MDKDKILRMLKGILRDDQILMDEPMSKHTSFKIGGNADFLVLPQTEGQVVNLIKSFTDEQIFVMGNGSNLLVSDHGIRGVVVKMGKNFSGITVNHNCITAQSGATLMMLARAALKNELGGVEFAAGIPGTVGGAVAMNAGAYGGEMKDIVVSTTYADESGALHQINRDEHHFGYRSSIFSDKRYIILSSTFELAPRSRNEIANQMKELMLCRKSKQPLTFPSAGSTFKRPAGNYAGKLIQDAGLSGYTIGGAKVSEKHNGFIINTGSATCEDVCCLIRHIQNTVFDKFGIKLETEVKMV